MRFCTRMQLARTRRILTDRQARITKAAREREWKRITRINVIPETRQLEIAMRALETQEAGTA